MGVTGSVVRRGEGWRQAGLTMLRGGSEGRAVSKSQGTGDERSCWFCRVRFLPYVPDLCEISACAWWLRFRNVGLDGVILGWHDAKPPSRNGPARGNRKMFNACEAPSDSRLRFALPNRDWRETTLTSSHIDRYFADLLHIVRCPFNPSWGRNPQVGIAWC